MINSITMLLLACADVAFAYEQSFSSQLGHGVVSSYMSHFLTETGFSTSVQTFYAFVFVAGLIALMVLAQCMDQDTEQTQVNNNQHNQDASDHFDVIKPQVEEYDFMGSQEAVPAKFNLVEAYIQMKDFAQARRVLDEILSVGSEDQRQKASAYISQLPSA